MRRTGIGIIALESTEEAQRIQAEAEYLADVRFKIRGPILEKDFEGLLCLAVELQQLNGRGGNPG
jgi:hypothetical protein